MNTGLYFMLVFTADLKNEKCLYIKPVSSTKINFIDRLNSVLLLILTNHICYNGKAQFNRSIKATFQNILFEENFTQ